MYGFNDKMINLKDDEVAINWAMAHIIDTYLVCLLHSSASGFWAVDTTANSHASGYHER